MSVKETEMGRKWETEGSSALAAGKPQRRDHGALEQPPTAEGLFSGLAWSLLEKLALLPGESLLEYAQEPGVLSRAAERCGLAVSAHRGRAHSGGGASPSPAPSFDAVGSLFEAVFAADHAQLAEELIRAVRPGGGLALLAWKQDSVGGHLATLLHRYESSLAVAGTALSDPLEWGRPEYAIQLLGEAFDLEFTDSTAHLEAPSGAAAWRMLSTQFGPVRSLYQRLPPASAASFHRAVVALFEEHRQEMGVRLPCECLLISGSRRTSGRLSDTTVLAQTASRMVSLPPITRFFFHATAR